MSNATAEPTSMTSSLPGILTACVSRAEVVLSDKKGAALATIFRNFDGACGRIVRIRHVELFWAEAFERLCVSNLKSIDAL